MDYELVVDDLHTVVERVMGRHVGLPVVLVGDSMGGMIAARYAQLHRDELVELVLSGPSWGRGPPRRTYWRSRDSG